jgi:hypothetical protein
LQMTNKEREIAIRLRKLEAEGIKEGSAAYKEFEERLRAAITARDAVQEGINQQQRYLEEWKRTADEINRTLTDALMRAFESGKGFGKAFKDTLVNMFQTMILRPILAPIVGGVAGAFGTPAIAGAAGAASMGTGFLGGITAAAGGFGTALAAGFTNALSLNFAGALQAAGGLIGTGTATGISAGLGMAAGTLMPIIAGIALVSSAFSRKLKDVGITGTFGEEGFAGQQFQFFKGGFLRSDKTVMGGLDPQLQSTLDQQFIGIRTATIEMARQLGLSSTAVEKFTKDVRLSFRGLTEQQIAEKLTAEFGKMADEMAELVLGAGATSQVLQELFVRVMQERNSLEQKLLQLQGDTVELRRREMETTHETNRELLQKIFNLEDEIAANNVLAEQERVLAGMRERVTQERISLEMRLLQIEGNTAEIRRREVGALDESNRSILERIFALEDERIAQDELNRRQQEAQAELLRQQQQAQDAINQITGQRISLENRLLQLQGDLVALRERELSEIDDSNKALLQRIFALEDEQRNAALFAQQQEEISRRQNEIYQERIRLERELLSVQGNTAALRELELAALDPSNRALQQQIYSYTDLARRQEEATRRQQQFTAALQGTVNTIIAEIQRLRGTAGGLSLPQLEAQFAITTARARAGSAEALEQLPQISQSITELVSQTATTNLDIVRVQGRLATSLEQTLNAIRRFGVSIPKFANGGYTPGGLAMVGEQGPELVNFSKPAQIYSSGDTQKLMGAEAASEIRALREENRAQSRSLVSLQARMTRLLERWDGDGLPEERVVS